MNSDATNIANRASHRRSLARKAAAAFLFLLVPLASERTLSGYLLTLLALGVFVGILGMAQYLFFPVDQGPKAKRLVNALALLTTFFGLTHMLVYAPYFDGGALYYGCQPLILDGSPTLMGYAFSFFHGLFLATMILLLFWRGETK